MARLGERGREEASNNSSVDRSAMRRSVAVLSARRGCEGTRIQPPSAARSHQRSWRGVGTKRSHLPLKLALEFQERLSRADALRP